MLILCFMIYALSGFTLISFVLKTPNQQQHGIALHYYSYFETLISRKIYNEWGYIKFHQGSKCFSIELNKYSLNGEIWRGGKKKTKQEVQGKRKWRLLHNLNTIRLSVCFVVWACVFGIVVFFRFWIFLQNCAP